MQMNNASKKIQKPFSDNMQYQKGSEKLLEFWIWNSAVKPTPVIIFH